MKHEAKSKACRLDLSVGEMETLLRLVEMGHATRDAAFMPRRDLIHPLIDGLRAAIKAQQLKIDDARSAAAARRDSGKLDSSRRKIINVDGHSVMATLGDFIDTSTSLDYTSWMMLAVVEAQGKLPAQAEIRRDVWNVVVMTSEEQRAADDSRMTVGGDCTENSDAAGIEPLARTIISKGVI